MPTLETVSPDYLFSMFKGEPGTRKSTCALSYPTPQYWVSTDQKMEALLKPMKNWSVDPKSVEYDDYTDWSKVNSKLSQLQIQCKFKTIIIDSITSLGDCMTSQVKKAKRADNSGKSIGGIPVSGFEEFNAESSAFQEMIAQLKDIHKFSKVHVILIAHVVGIRKDDDKNKLTHHSRRIVTGAEQISAKIASYVTEAYHFNVIPSIDVDKEGQYGLLTVHTGNDYARTSLPLPREIIFNDKQLYSNYIQPAINSLKQSTSTQPTVSKPQSLEVK